METIATTQLRHFPAQTVLSRIGRVTVAGLDAFIEESIAMLGREAAAAGMAPDAAPVVLYHGDVDDARDGPVEVCLPVPSKPVAGIRQLPAITALVAQARGEACDFPAILSVYGAIMDRIAEEGLVPDGPGREIHHQEDGERRILVAMPIASPDRSA
ncbi:hypothetical protein [Chelativorans intermedius]|uniref:GyrI-like small molecule binding domain-containing protein n=1 Tax=Chelativorans intermedius TaxID=515947 RepID=A0ABV6D4J2_9HYPH|nr:hypothetical protein [Chelativorans intermedius]MCT8997545.1 hypothetical protein [Chelativorans intermedius]